MSKKVRTLLRVSSKQQLHEDDIPVQRAEARQYIEGRSGWVFDREYIEKAVSGYKNGVEDREVLQEILADAKEKQFDILLTYMSDRIGRQEEYSFYVAALNRLGIEVWTIKDGQLKTEEHIDKLLNYIRFWQNEGESKKTGMRVRDTQRELVKAGKFVGGRAPFGYRLVPSGMVSSHGRLLKKLEIVGEDANTVRRIFELAVHQGMGYVRIAGELNRQGIPAVSGGEWKAGTIRGILTNPVYMGYLAIGRRENHGTLTRLDRREWVYSEEQIQELVIVSAQLWERAQEIREARKEKIRTAGERTSQTCREGSRIPFCTGGKLALMGFVYCGHCGRRLENGSYYNRWVTKSGERKAAFTGRYICRGKCGGCSGYSRELLESVVFRAVEDYMMQIDFVDVSGDMRELRERKRKRAEKEWKAACRQLDRLRQDIATLEEKIPEAIRGTGYFSEEKLASMLKEKERDLQEGKRKKEQAEREWKEAERQNRIEEKAADLPDWKEEFRNAGIPAKRMLLSSLICGIQVKEEEIRICFKVCQGSAIHGTDGFGVPEPGL
jgi:Site-specific recombinases, DNA invertase Pin homologs